MLVQQQGRQVQVYISQSISNIENVFTHKFYLKYIQVKLQVDVCGDSPVPLVENKMSSKRGKYKWFILFGMVKLMVYQDMNYNRRRPKIHVIECRIIIPVYDCFVFFCLF